MVQVYRIENELIVKKRSLRNFALAMIVQSHDRIIFTFKYFILLPNLAKDKIDF